MVVRVRKALSHIPAAIVGPKPRLTAMNMDADTPSPHHVKEAMIGKVTVPWSGGTSTYASHLKYTGPMVSKAAAQMLFYGSSIATLHAKLKECYDLNKTDSIKPEDYAYDTHEPDYATGGLINLSPPYIAGQFGPKLVMKDPPEHPVVLPKSDTHPITLSKDAGPVSAPAQLPGPSPPDVGYIYRNLVMVLTPEKKRVMAVDGTNFQICNGELVEEHFHGFDMLATFTATFTLIPSLPNFPVAYEEEPGATLPAEVVLVLDKGKPMLGIRGTNIAICNCKTLDLHATADEYMTLDAEFIDHLTPLT